MSDILTAENIRTARNVIEAIEDHPRFNTLVSGHGFESNYDDIRIDLDDLPEILGRWAEEEREAAAEKAKQDDEKYVQIAREYVGDFQWAIMDQATRQQTIDNARNLIRLWEQRA